MVEDEALVFGSNCKEKLGSCNIGVVTITFFNSVELYWPFETTLSCLLSINL